MKEQEEKFYHALEGKRIPVLTLDNKWYRLFNQIELDEEIPKLEEELNCLLKRQGKLNTESKSIKTLKKNLMDEIVSLMDEENLTTQKKVEENQRLIKECNDKLEEYQEELFDIPKMIDEKNRELMLKTMEICYFILKDNNTEIEEIGNWIANVRVELKKNLIRKQEKEKKNHDLYSYMHDIFGPEVVEIFDLKYNEEK
ncbi:MAG: hypothetical protein ACRC7V_00340 [Lachnospiraceae bacterium]